MLWKLTFFPITSNSGGRKKSQWLIQIWLNMSTCSPESWTLELVIDKMWNHNATWSKYIFPSYANREALSKNSKTKIYLTFLFLNTINSSKDIFYKLTFAFLQLFYILTNIKHIKRWRSRCRAYFLNTVRLTIKLCNIVIVTIESWNENQPTLDCKPNSYIKTINFYLRSPNVNTKLLANHCVCYVTWEHAAFLKMQKSQF